ncbi:condensin complex component cnd2 [Ophiocordyceps camponoti-floridani]|uniref:Condensin complex subunit 2 n=1 Tax=Ophiocordyceps camponoti-floridani TaxID=2030778 RepID=A0A8H4Q0U7_9HYPO|nr:condensin complex component cnd2 [Ophiocordyceps camponoti-floridani]
MPRVAQVPRPGGAATASMPASPFKSPVKIPLNDDAHEKGQRLNSRKALHERHIKQIKAAATPRKHASSVMDSEGASPRTPGSQDEAITVGGVTPMKRVPILANFEEWMKMATDNKINATNSWNFALIDYFHDMSLLKEGDGVNFQKASCTLDGCVKIYTNRVDSVATETGKLLSGLSDSKKKDGEGEGEGEDAGTDDDVDGEGGGRTKAKKKTQRWSEATLAPSFAALQLKKFELEFAVDPLFKKASADFDEGGARGLLLNHLMIDSRGRIVFDSSDDSEDAVGHDKKQDDDQEEDKADDAEEENAPIDLASLSQRFFPDLSRLDELDVCPSLKNFDLGGGSMDIPFLKAIEDEQKTSGDTSGAMMDDAANPLPDYDDDDDDDHLGALTMAEDVAFGEGGEAWAREAALAPHMRVLNVERTGADADEDADEDDLEDGRADYNIISMTSGGNVHDDMLNFFDQALCKNWTRAEHWRIRKIKDNSKGTETLKARRREKEPFEVDFLSPLNQPAIDALSTQASSNAAISLARKDWTAKSRNLVPEDGHFSSRSLLSLFLKPRARLASRRTRARRQVPLDMDEAFWAKQHHHHDDAHDDDDGPPPGNYDADFFHDDGLPFPSSPPPHQTATKTSQTPAPTPPPQRKPTTLVTSTRRLRPEYVQYARRAKKVDVRRLKEEMWRAMDFTTPPTDDDNPNSNNEKQDDNNDNNNDHSLLLTFTSILTSLQKAYPKQTMDDISTSYCFICLLHLANEKGLQINKTPALDELFIQRDSSANLDD